MTVYFKLASSICPSPLYIIISVPFKIAVGRDDYHLRFGSVQQHLKDSSQDHAHKGGDMVDRYLPSPDRFGVLNT